MAGDSYSKIGEIVTSLPLSPSLHKCGEGDIGGEVGGNFD